MTGKQLAVLLVVLVSLALTAMCVGTLMVLLSGVDSLL